jgi:hypothetical protein
LALRGCQQIYPQPFPARTGHEHHGSIGIKNLVKAVIWHEIPRYGMKTLF